MKKNSNSLTAWIGMLTVSPQKHNNDLNDAHKAVVNVLYYTDCATDYIKSVSLKMNEYGFDIIEIEDVDEFDFNSNSKDLIEKARLLDNENNFNWGDFYLVED